MLSHSCKSAIKAVVYLSTKAQLNIKSNIKEIANAIEVSEHTLGKVMQVLVKQKVICSEKGPTGGFYITTQQMNLPLMSIIDAIDGKEILNECVLGLSKCSSTKPCALHNQYKEARDLLEKIYKSNRICDLGDSVYQGISFLIN